MMNNIFRSVEFEDVKRAFVCWICTTVATIVFAYFRVPTLPLTIGGLVTVTGYMLLTVRDFVNLLDYEISRLEDEL